MRSTMERKGEITGNLRRRRKEETPPFMSFSLHKKGRRASSEVRKNKLFQQVTAQKERRRNYKWGTASSFLSSLSLSPPKSNHSMKIEGEKKRKRRRQWAVEGRDGGPFKTEKGNGGNGQTDFGHLEREIFIRQWLIDVRPPTVNIFFSSPAKKGG